MRARILVLVAGLATVGAAAAAGPDEVASAATEVRPLLVGAEVPSVVLRNPLGAPVSLREKVAEKPTVLIFYRGGW